MASDRSAGGATAERAHAKLNLGLRVLGRRPDGFHAVDTTMVAIDLHDDVGARPAESADALVRRTSGDRLLDRTPLPLDRGNLVLRALDAHRRAAASAGAPPAPPLLIELRKRVPLAAGLGGGSSDAAAVLRLLERLWPSGLELAGVAAALGSDVPFFLAGHQSARARGRGEILERLPEVAMTAVLVNPGVPVSAADAYRWWSGAASDGQPSAVRWGPFDLVNDLEAGVAARVPAVAEVLAWLRARARGPVAMSGSGASCFALLDDEREAAALAARARRERSWWARVVHAAPAAGASADGRLRRSW